jgi:hypothetical protein
MKKLIAIVVVATISLGTAIAKDDPATPALALLGKAANCTDKASPWRPWCIALDWGTGKVEQPKGTLIGLTVELEDNTDFKAALSSKVTMVALAITGDKAKLVDIKPTEKGEDVTIGKAVAAVAMVFKGKDKTAILPKDLAGYIATRTGDYKMTKGVTELSWQGKSTARLRKVGAFWVMIERPAAGNGIWVTILTDAWK